MSKVERAVRNDPRVTEVSDERKPGDSKSNPGDGIWVYLVSNLCHHGLRGGDCVKGGCVHSVHEYTWTDVAKGLREVGPCNCGDCDS